MTADTKWLQEFIERAVRERMCVQIHCTTCGARAFRDELWTTVGGGSKGALGPMFGNAGALAELMSGLMEKDGYTYEHEKVLRLMLFEIWPFLGAEEGESKLESTLRGTWAGRVLDAMKAHEAARRALRRAHDEREANAPKRREEKKRQKAERHAARLTAKVERDRLWREKQKGGKD